MATTGTTGTTGTTPTTAQQNTIPNTTQQLAAPGVQPASAFQGMMSAFQGSNQTPTPTGQVMDPLAFQLPSGFSMGSGANYGASYYNGQKVIGTNAQGQYVLENGAVGPAASTATDQAIQNAANQGFQTWSADPNNPVNQASTYTPAIQTALQTSVPAQQQYNALMAQIGGSQPTPEQSAQLQQLTNTMSGAWSDINAKAATLPQRTTGYYDANGTWIDPSQTPAEYLIGGLRVDANGNPVQGANAYNALSEMYRESGRTPGAIDSTIMQMLNQNPALMSNLPQDQYDALARTLAATQPGFNIPARASDTSAGGQLPQNIPALSGPQTGGMGGGTGGTGGTSTGSNTGSGAGSGLGPNMSPVDPNNDLRNQQITPGDLLDRFKLAGQQYDTFASATSPQYDAALRDATRAAAGAGRLGSGMLRTSYGDLANQRTQALQNERDTLFQNALLGSVQDQQTKFSDLLAEQQYQTQAQNQAFNQSLSAQQLQELLTSGAFSRALQMFNAGQQGTPYDMQLELAKLWGNQANAANMSAGTMATALGGMGANSGIDPYTQYLLNQANSSGLFNPVNPPANPTGVSPTMPGVQVIGSY